MFWALLIGIFSGIIPPEKVPLLKRIVKRNKKSKMKKELKSNGYTFLIDNGHGGIIDGEYQTAGKRSPVWSDGVQLFEGEFNRAVAQLVGGLLLSVGKKVELLVPEEDDIALYTRVARANAQSLGTKGKAILISIHANAGGGTGLEVFTSVGQTKSDEYATVIFTHMAKEFPELKQRKDMIDGDPDKESQFYILRKTICPAILIECAFMDTLNPDCDLLITDEGRQRFAVSIANALIEIDTA